MAGEYLSVKIEGVEQLRKKLDSTASADVRRRMNLEIGYNVQERTADHIARASVSRHKTADRLGAPHSGFLEFAPGRQRSEGKFKNTDGSHPFIQPQEVMVDSVTIVIGNTPGLSRAFHPLIITPKRAKALTLPINAVSYAKRVRDVEDEGWKIHREGKALVGQKGTSTLSLFVLCGKANIPQDRGLLPLETEIGDWAADTADAFIDLELERN